MASLYEISAFLDELLELDRYAADDSNNGLQFQGVPEVTKAVFAVDGCEAVFNMAADINAELIFVHHGISWGPGIRRFRDVTARRITTLAANGMSLYAAHLPLDAHEIMGHNALLAGMLDLQDLDRIGTYRGIKIGFQGELKKPMTLKAIAKVMDKELPSEGDFQVIGDPDAKVRHPAIVSGGGAWPDIFSEIAAGKVDCLITGEMGHAAFHYALETGTPVLTLGHYRSETPGVFAVMNTIREKFQIDCEFIDCPTGL
ncbi:MAG: Nif3-like dinuclear metal center hexameric protein [Lentisphaeria bacterium]|nr:Nif3-like dinuclear metal center hexameric protein [Lentisphaeria bacterium]